MTGTQTRLPDGFLDYLGPYPIFRGLEQALASEPSPVSIRLNAGKPAPSWLRETEPERVPWCPWGFYLPERRSFTRDPAFHQGRYYVQEAASMFHSHVVSALLSGHGPVTALDACAAPGGKTTAVIDVLPRGSVMVANEFSPTRAAVLRENLMKHGAAGVVSTVGPAQKFAGLEEAFDLVLADVPCSGEGMMRKEPAAVAQWSPALVESCAATQRDIVTGLWRSLRPGGLMVYSTCTFNRTENELMVDHLVGSLGAESVEVPGVEASWGISPGLDTPHHCYRFVPGLTRSEGLFVAAVRKPGTPTGTRGDLAKRLGRVTRVAGAERADERVALHGSVMSQAYGHGYPECEVGADTALDYLRGNAVKIDAPRGLVLLTHEGQPLGMVKNLVSRANNLYPQSLRIRSTY